MLWHFIKFNDVSGLLDRKGPRVRNLKKFPTDGSSKLIALR